MDLLEEIRKSKRKPKELVTFLAEKVKKDKKLIGQVIEGLKTGSKVERGICAEVLEYATKDKPELVIPHLDTIIEYINYDAPRVKWETSRVVGNVAQEFPEKVTKAIPKLWKNTEDKGTVVRWSAAFALSEIAKSDSRARKELLPKFRKIIDEEENNGVRNVYLKALKAVGESK